MATITIDGAEYESESLEPEAKAQVDMLIYTEQKIRQLQADLALAQTAHTAYATRLRALLPAGETVKIEGGFAG
jgi:hypothetical protein